MIEFQIIDDIPCPELILELCMAEVNLGSGKLDPLIELFVEQDVHPTLLQHLPGLDRTVKPCAFHVHVGHVGVTPHEHHPYLMTTILYLTDAVGQLVINPGRVGEQRVTPKEGRLVVIPGDLLHSVEASPHPELRVALVVSYN